MRNRDVAEMLLVNPMQTRGIDENKSSGETSYLSSFRRPWTINKWRGAIQNESIHWNWSFHWITTNVRLVFSRRSRSDLFHGKQGGNYLKLNGRSNAWPREPSSTPHNPKGTCIPVAEKAQSPPLEGARCCALALKVGLTYGLDVGPSADNTTYVRFLKCHSWQILIGIKKMKMNSRDDDLDVESHILWMIREMEDLHDGKGKGIWRENGASSSPLPSLLYLHSAIMRDAVTPYTGYSGRP